MQEPRMTPDPSKRAALPQRALRPPGRRGIAAALVVLSVVAMTASTLAVWIRQTVYDTDRFLSVVEPALRDPTFYDGLSAIVTDVSLEALDLDARIRTVLDDLDAYVAAGLLEALGPDPRRLERLQAIDRPTLGALTPAISQPLEDRVARIVDDFVTSEEFQTRLPDLVRRTHTAGVALVSDDLAALPNVYLEGDEVRVDLLPIVADALRPVVAELRGLLPDITLPPVVADATEQERAQLRERLAAALETELPEDLGQLTIMQRSALEEAQTIARYVDRSVWVLTVLAVALVVAALVRSPDRRRTVMQLALGVAGGLAVTLLLVRRVEGAILARVTDPDSTQAVGSLLGQLVTNLRAVTMLVVTAALLVGVVAYLSDRPGWTTARMTRRPARPEPGPSISPPAPGPAGSPTDR
jgi:hypothetical protein